MSEFTVLSKVSKENTAIHKVTSTDLPKLQMLDVTF